jgi:hypothetical protein
MKITQLDRLKKIVEFHFNVEDLRDKSRVRPLPHARFMFFKIAKENFQYVMMESEYGGMREVPLTFELLGSYMGVHHATILHGIKTINDIMAYEKGVRESYHVITTGFLEDGEVDELILKKRALESFRERIEIKISRLETAIKQKMEASEVDKEIEEEAEFIQTVKEFLERE